MQCAQKLIQNVSVIIYILWLQETSEIFPFVLENFTALDKGIEKYISDLDISKFD